MRNLSFLRFPFALLALAACGGSVESPSGATPPSDEKTGDATAPFVAPSFCPSPDYIATAEAIFTKLAPSPAPDYLALRLLSLSVPESLPSDAGLITLRERGTLCATATDRAACSKAHAALSTQDRLIPFVTYTRGDVIAKVTTVAKAIAFLGVIDAPEEAYFIADLASYRYPCGGKIPTGYRAAPDGFDLVTSLGGCGKPLERVVLRVHGNGVLEEIARETVEPETSACAQP